MQSSVKVLLAASLCALLVSSGPSSDSSAPRDVRVPAATAEVDVDGPSRPPSPGREPVPAEPSPDQRPNIVLVMTDDQNRNELEWMPKTQRLLGRHGVTFSGALSPAPLCCPARAMTLTGQYGQNNGVRDNFGPFGGFPALIDKGNTLAAWLQDVGYQTALVGKYLNGYEGDNTPPQRGWSRWYPAVGNAYGYYDTVFLDGKGGRVTHHGNVTPYISRRTNDLVRTFSATDKPFFIWASHLPPHGAYAGTSESGGWLWEPPRATPKHLGLLGSVPLPSLLKPSFDAGGGWSDPYPQPPMSWDRAERTQAVFTGRLQALQDVDDAVESLVRVLRRTGELRNTYIIFVSDNGQLLGEHRLVTKDVLYREALEIPLVVRVPGGAGDPAGARDAGGAEDAGGVTSDLPVTIVDLAPTIVDLTGATPGRTMDGMSFAPLLHGRDLTWRTTQLIQTGSEEAGGPQQGWEFRGVWTRRYTYMRRVSDGAEFLYDRRDDPYELVDLAAVPEYLAVLDALRSRHDQLIDCRGAPCNRSFGPLPRPG